MLTTPRLFDIRTSLNEENTYMKTLLISLATTIGLATATPAVAQSANANFTGPRIEASVGVDDLSRNIRSSDLNYGAAVGLDAPLGSHMTIGVEANLDNVFEREDFGVSGRLGLALTNNILVYGNAGYTRFRALDGVRVGGGVELSTGTPLYGKAEYRYSDLQANVGRHSGLLGIGLRF